MPTYDYECGGCGHVFEVFEGIHDACAKECPKCGKRRARRKLSAPAGVIFKGSGFHVTDYKASSSGSQKKTARKKADASQTKSDKTEKK